MSIEVMAKEFISLVCHDSGRECPQDRRREVERLFEQRQLVSSEKDDEDWFKALTEEVETWPRRREAAA